MEWYALAIISAIFSAIAAIYEKKSMQKNLTITFCAIFAIISLIISTPFLFIINPETLTTKIILLILTKSIISGLAFFLIIYSFRHLELSSALPLLVLTPGIVAILAFLFLGENLTSKQITGMILLIIGSYLVLINKKTIEQSFQTLEHSKGHIAIGTALILFTASALLDKIILAKYKVPETTYIFFYFLFIAIIFTTTLLISKQRKTFFHSFKKTYKLILIIAISTVIFRYSQFLAIKTAPSVALVISLKRLSVLFATIIGGKLFNETHILRKTIATAIMIVGSTLIII
jgi:drug/metabolite transporter (DMT)-like permease